MTQRLRLAFAARFWLAGLFLAATVLGTAGAARAGDEDHSFEGFREIRPAPGVSTSQRLMDLLDPFIGNHPEALEGNPTLKLELRVADDMIVFDLEKGGLLDDSVLAEHWRGHIIETTEGWELLSMAVKETCARGKSSSGLCN